VHERVLAAIVPGTVMRRSGGCSGSLGPTAPLAKKLAEPQLPSPEKYSQGGKAEPAPMSGTVDRRGLRSQATQSKEPGSAFVSSSSSDGAWSSHRSSPDAADGAAFHARARRAAEAPLPHDAYALSDDVLSRCRKRPRSSASGMSSRRPNGAAPG